MSDVSLITRAIGRDWHFRLTIGQWMKLQAHFGGGPQKISARLSSDEWKVEEIREVIERGLEGGGLEPAAARTSATDIMDGQSQLKSYELATDILSAAWGGVEELFKKKEVMRKAEAILSRIGTGNGASETSSAPESSSESSPPKPSGSASQSSSK